MNLIESAADELRCDCAVQAAMMQLLLGRKAGPASKFNPTTKHTLYGRGLRVVLDPDQCIPHDPGAGCPVIIWGRAKDGFARETEVSATWRCAMNEGELDGFPLTSGQKAWLREIEPAVEAWLHSAWRNAYALVNGGAL